MEFRGEKHRQIFQNYIRWQKHRPSAHHLAAVYLLTADKTLWKQVRGAFRDGKADLSAVHLCGIQPDAYALFRSAKELLTGEPMVGREGHRGGTWVVLDYGCVVVHVFTEETRACYDLERLWQDGKQVIAIDDGLDHALFKLVIRQLFSFFTQ